MELVKLAATPRETSGKNTSRRLRATGQIPAVAYGKGKEALHLAVAPKEILGVLGLPHGRNSVIELQVEGKESFSALLCDFQYHPVTRALLHADFLQISLDEPVDVHVPLELTGKAKGTLEGGVLRQVYRKIPLRCLPKDIPVKLTHDVTELDIDDNVVARELALPPNVTMLIPAEQTVVAVSTEKKVMEEEAPTPEAAAAAAAAAGATGAAPAAGTAAAPEGGAPPPAKGAGKAESKGGKPEK